MEIIEYEPINLYDGRFCKVFHSDWIQLEKPKDVNLAPHFHWHNSFEFNCSISGTLIEQDVVNRHRKEIMGLLMDIYRYSRSEKPVDLLGMNACVLQIFHILLSESMATPACTTPPDQN